MAVRRESVVLDVTDNLTPALVRAAAAAQVLDKSLDRVSGRAVQTSRGTKVLANDVDRVTRSTDQGASSLDRYSGRLGLLAQAAAILGPAFLPIGAVIVPALTGLATAGTAAAVAGGSMIVAFQGVGDALTAMNDQALDPSAENLEKLREAMDKLGPDAREFVREFQEFRPVLTDIRNSAAAGWFPGLIESLDDFAEIAPRVADLFEDIGRAGGQMVADTAESFNSDRWLPFFDFVNAELPGALLSLGRTVGDLTHGAAEMWMAFDPANDKFLGWLEGVADGFDRWASSADGREDMAAFLDYVAETGPQVEDFFVALVSMLTQVSQAAAPLGGPVLQALTGVANAVAAIADSDLGTPIFAGLAALSLYNRALATTAALQRSAFGMGVAGSAPRRSPMGAIGGQLAPAAGLAGLLAVTSAQERATTSADKLAAAESKRAAATRAGIGASLKGAGALGGLGLAATGAADGLGIANGATLGLLGTLGGPWGAAIGAGIGLTLDMAAANDALTDSIQNAQGAVAAWDFGGMVTGLSSAISELDTLEGKVDQSSKWNNFDIGATLAGNKNMIEGWFGKSDLEEGEQAIAGIAAQMDYASGAAAALGEALGMTVGPLDGSAASARELDAAVQAAQPKMDGLRFTMDDLALAHKVASGEANYFETTVAGTLPTFDEMLAQIAGTDGATVRYSDTMRQAAKAAREERAALDEATNAMREKMNAALAGFDAETRYRQALKDAAEQASKNSEGIKGSTDAALENRGALANLAGAWNNQSNAVKNNEKRFRESRSAFIETATAMGVPEDAAKRLANRLMEIPRSVVAKIEARGAAEAEAEAARVQRALDNIRDRTVFIKTVSTSVAAARDTSAPLATRNADGGSVPKTGLPYADRHFYMLADGEEVISNRRGQADRFRPLLKAINNAADGATVGKGYHASVLADFGLGRSSSDAARGLKQLQAALKETERVLSEEKQARQAVISQVSGNFMSDPFAASSNPWASSGGVLGNLRGDIRDAREYTSLIERFSKGKRGLSGAALAEVDTLAEAQALKGLGRDGRRKYERLYDRRESVSAGAGRANADGSAATVAELRVVSSKMDSLELAIKRADDNNKKGHDEAPQKAGKAFADGINGATKKARQESRR